MRRIPTSLRAAAAKAIAERVVTMTGAATLEALASGADPKAVRKFRMEAYNGGAMRFRWSDVPVVVDLAGMTISAKARPVLKDHDTGQVVGHSTSIRVESGKLRVDGIASGGNQVTADVLNAADNGFPWQASIGCDIGSIEEVRAGASVSVNGQTFTGPCLIVRASTLGEISFVALGADDSTEVRLVAGKSLSNPPRNQNVKNPILLAALLALTASFPHLATELAAKAEVVDVDDEESKKGETELKAWAESQPKSKEPEPKDDQNDDAALKASRKAKADEARRVYAITKICAGRHGDIEAKAIEEGWSAEKAELEVLRAARPKAPGIIRGSDEGITAKVLEAAVCQNARMANIEKCFDAKVLEAASKRFRSAITLGELMLEAAYANGYTGRALKVDREVLRAAFGGLQASGVSTIDITGILSNIANKSILNGFMAVDQSWRQIAAIASVTDFKQVTRYRMTGDLTYEEVGPSGKIKHGDLGEESFTNQARTYAKMLGISRNDFINDNLGALTKAGDMLGRGAALKFNDVFWTEFLADHATFFPVDGSKGNYFDGASASLLTIDGLTTAEQKFLDQEDADDQPLALSPRTLLVPTGLKVKGEVLMASTEVRDTTANTKAGIANPHAGKFKVVCSPYLNKARIPNSSSTAWYLLADAAELAAIEAVFLNGQESPTIETADADFSELGVQMRGYHDFGVEKQDDRAAVKSKGAG